MISTDFKSTQSRNIYFVSVIHLLNILISRKENNLRDCNNIVEIIFIYFQGTQSFQGKSETFLNNLWIVDKIPLYTASPISDSHTFCSH